MMPSVIVQADRQLPSIITRSPTAAALCIFATYIGINPPPSLVIIRALAGRDQSRVEAKISFFIIFSPATLLRESFTRPILSELGHKFPKMGYKYHKHNRAGEHFWRG
jgi:hypothetical protein